MNKKANTGYSFFETFVGAGGSHLGFIKENFRTVYANDISDECLKTLDYNNPNLKLENAFLDDTSIMDINPSELRKKLKVDVGEIDVFFGGIVCKGFSLAGEKSPNDERNFFYHKQLDLVKEFMPIISIIENVPGIIHARVLSIDTPQFIKDKVDNLWQKLENYKGQKAQLRKINKITDDFIQKGIDLRTEKKNMISELEKKGYLISVLKDIEHIYDQIGYNVQYKLLNAAWYGSSTKRERMIMVAVRKDIHQKFVYPAP